MKLNKKKTILLWILIFLLFGLLFGYYVLEELHQNSYVNLSMEAEVLGIGVLVHSESFPLQNGENAAATLVRFLEQEGYSCVYHGTIEKDFYLEGVVREDLLNEKPVLAEQSISYMEAHNYSYDSTRYLPGSIKEFYFSKGSGWMFQVNGSYPKVGLSDYKFRNGDLVVLRYTLCYGHDIEGEEALD